MAGVSVRFDRNWNYVVIAIWTIVGFLVLFLDMDGQHVSPSPGNHGDLFENPLTITHTLT